MKRVLNFWQEVHKSLAEESAFDTDMLKKYKTAISKAEGIVAQCVAEKEAEEALLAYLSEQYQSISDWAVEFGLATNDEKKMILARLIQKITVDWDYHITLTFYVSLADFTGRCWESLQMSRLRMPIGTLRESPVDRDTLGECHCCEEILTIRYY